MAALAGLVVLAALQSTTALLASTRVARKGSPHACAALDDTSLMRAALEQAELARRQGEVPVGAVFVVYGVEVARGANATNAAMDATRHAELVAVDAALEERRAVDWRNATLYVTCEPCIMCAAALSQLGLRRCFFGCSNEK